MAQEITAGGITVPLTHPDKVEAGPDPWAGFAGSARGLGAASKRLARLED